MGAGKNVCLGIPGTRREERDIEAIRERAKAEREWMNTKFRRVDDV